MLRLRFPSLYLPPNTQVWVKVLPGIYVKGLLSIKINGIYQQRTPLVKTNGVYK